MTTYVIVHGEFAGGWEWTPVARLLRALGHEVFTPSLTGLGEHSHLASGQVVGLATHVEDIVGVLEFEDLHDVVLVGAGFGGVPVTGAADRAAHRVALVVYVDALVPVDRESALDLLPPSYADMVIAGLDEYGEKWRAPIPPSLQPQPGWRMEDERSRRSARVREQPAMSLLEPVYLTGAVDHIARAFVRCAGGDGVVGREEDFGGDPYAAMAVRAQRGFWHYRELDAAHDVHLSDPAAIVRVLSELTAAVLGQGGATATDFPTQATGERHDPAAARV